VYEPWIDLRATLCILDPRQLLDEKTVNNDNFRDQLAADIIVANKSDRETPESARCGRLVAALGRRAPPGVAPRAISTSPCSMSRAATPPTAGERGARPPPSPTTGLAALSLAGHQRWRRHTSTAAGLSGLRLDLRRRKRSLTPSACSWARLAPVARVKGVMRIAEGAVVRINRQGEDLHIENPQRCPAR
jgi:G3E family GTPase